MNGCCGCADEDWANLDWSKAPAIQELPVTSAIVVPKPGDTIPKGTGTFTVKGYAVAGGGRDVVRVDVSADGGKTWRSAKLLPRPDAADVGYRQNWAWTHWEVRLLQCLPAQNLASPHVYLHIAYFGAHVRRMRTVCYVDVAGSFGVLVATPVLDVFLLVCRLCIRGQPSCSTGTHHALVGAEKF